MANVAIQEVALTELSPSPDNPRKSAGSVEELASSIQAVGIIEPLVVTPAEKGKGYTVVCGSRRLAAAKQAKVSQVPVVVREDLDRKAALEIMLVENLQRDDLTPLEEADGFHRLIEEFGYSQRDLASRVGCSQAHISKRISLLDLPKTMQKQVDTGSLGLGDAQEYARIADKPELLKQAVELKGDDPFMSVKTAVDRIQATAKRDEAVAAGTKKAEEQGLKVAPDWRNKLMLGFYERVGREGVPAKGHAKLPCHAVGIEVDGSHVIVCTDPESHVKDKTKAVNEAAQGTKQKVADDGKVTAIDKKAQKTEAAKKAHETALRNARKAREEFITKLASKRVPKTGILEYAVVAWAESANTFTVQKAAKYLGLEQGKGNDFLSWGQIVADYADESPDNAGKTAFAMICATYEGQLAASWGGDYTSDSIVNYFEFLETKGYEVSATEKAAVAGHPSTK